jgi:hypothetical protein
MIRRGPLYVLVVAASVSAASMSPAEGQFPALGSAPIEALRTKDFTAGSPSEHTLLVLSLLSNRQRSTTLRPLAPRERDGLLAPMSSDSAGQQEASWMTFGTPAGMIWFNSDRAHHEADGPVWQGRGLTAAITGGVLIQARLFSLALRPVGFASQNVRYTPFVVAPDSNAFNTQQVVGGIDLPYRFGRGSYARIDPGESWARFGTSTFGIGASTSSQQWGPSHFSPLVLGTEAPGIPRVFAEARSVSTFLGSGSVQWIVGRLESTVYTGLPVGSRSRLITALFAAFSPSLFPGLEVGASRFFHVRWQPGVTDWAVLTLPMKGLTKARNPTNESFARDYNQLVSVFGRIAPPGAAFEVYGEFYREDHNIDVRDLLVEPDHASAINLGLRRVWRSGTDIIGLTMEGTNGRQSHLKRVRTQGAVYVHGGAAEGHTHLGQLLGSSSALGGGGLRVGLERIGARRTLTIDGEVRHTAHNMEGGAWSGRQSGLYSLTAGGFALNGTTTYGILVGIESGFGWERGANVKMSFQARP